METLAQAVRRSVPVLSLKDFAVEAWPVLEPSVEFVSGWHIDAICEHLEACTRGDIKRLVINIPPRCMKSLLTCVMWPCWVWTFWPSSRWLFSSYSVALSVRDSLKCRRLITSDWYRSNWGHVFSICSDQNMRNRFENTCTGFRVATGVGGLGTGEGGDFIVVDDPHKTQEAESDSVRRSVVRWWTETMSTRGNDPNRSCWVIVMQRLHEDDLSGHVLSHDFGYEHLCLPMRYESRRTIYIGGKSYEVDTKLLSTSIGFVDPRTEEGELLWPERFDSRSVDELSRALGEYGASGQYQQRPAPRYGGIFNRNWFPVIRDFPSEARRVRYWDKASSTDSRSPYSAGVLIALVEDEDGRRRFCIEDIVRGRWSADQRESIIDATAARDGYDVEIWLEQEPGSGGKESAEDTVSRLSGLGYMVHKESVSGNKVLRSDPFAAAAEAGLYSILIGSWNADFLDEISMFPYGRFSDQVDAASGAHNKLAQMRYITIY